MSELGIFYPNVPEEIELETLNVTENGSYTSTTGKAWNEVNVSSLLTYANVELDVDPNLSNVFTNVYICKADDSSQQSSYLIYANSGVTESFKAILYKGKTQAYLSSSSYKFRINSGLATFGQNERNVFITGDCSLTVIGA